VDGLDLCHARSIRLSAAKDSSPLGVIEGSTANANVLRGLIASLRDRGLDASEGILFVLDGAKAPHKAV